MELDIIIGSEAFQEHRHIQNVHMGVLIRQQAQRVIHQDLERHFVLKHKIGVTIW